MSSKAAATPETSVLIVARSAERRHALRSMLSRSQEFAVSDASSSSELSTALRRSPPRVVLIEVHSDEAEPAITLSQNGSAVVLLADSPDPGWVAHLLASGVGAVLSRDCNPGQIAAAVRAAAAGLTVFDPETAQALLRPAAENIALEPGEEELTPRETEVLRMMTAGLSNREIAATLGISEHTVKFHITSIFGKLGTSSRTEAVTEGLRRGLVLL